MRVQFRHFLSILGMILGLAHIVDAQVPVALAPLAKQQFFSVTGAPLASGCLFTYISGTSTPLATYQDSTGTTQNTNPVILDAGGFGNLWLSNSAYRFQLFSTGGVNCATGTLQYTVDGVSAYSIINQSQNLFLAGAASDPGGTAGELAYRTDIPCFRGFTTLWDCFVRLTDTQTLTNKTLTAPTITNPTITGGGSWASPTITNPTINGVTVSNGPATYLTVANAGGVGTVVNTLTKISGAPSTALQALTSDTGGIVGICIAGCANTGTATLQQSGTMNCIYDGATTAGDYVQISSTVAGNCHDFGAAFPTSGQILGRVLSTNGGGGAYSTLFFGPEDRPSASIFPNVVYNTASAPTLASIGATTMATAGGSGNTYRFSWYIEQTAAGIGCPASATTITVTLTWTSPNAPAPTGDQLSFNLIASGNGAAGQNSAVQSAGISWGSLVRAKAATVVQYSTTYAPPACGTVPQYQIYPVLELIQ